jgi:hypothetical protein
MPNMTTPKTKPIDRKKISEALLADRLGLNEAWIERWEKGGNWKEESSAPDRLPDFIRKNHNKEDIAGEIDRLVAAGCQRRVVYFCLTQLCPEAAWLRAGGERKPVFRKEHAATDDEDYELQKVERRIATREDLEAVANTAKAARKRIHRYQRELLLIAEAAKYPLPSGLICRPELPVDALEFLRDSLSWVATLAGAYTAPFKSTLLKSKGLLYLTLYVSMFADSKKLRGSKLSGLLRDSSKASGEARARGSYVAGDPLTNLVKAFTDENKDWSVSELYKKLNDFEEDHPRLYKRLAEKLKELHDFASR